MVTVEQLFIVFIAGLITDLATGLGALPFFYFRDISDQWTVALWGLASGIMVSASIFGLTLEGLAVGTIAEVGIGAIIGGVIVLGAHKIIHSYEFAPREIAEADFKKLMLILGILTVHSFPEGVAIGVAFAEIGLNSGIPVLNTFVPPLAIFMTIAIAIHNIPEGVAISIPIRDLGMSNWRMVGAAVFSSVPQPIGAVMAFYFVTLAQQILPYGFGFAAGAMTFLVFHELLPEALERGEGLPGKGYRELTAGLIVGFVLMLPLVLF